MSFHSLYLRPVLGSFALVAVAATTAHAGDIMVKSAKIEAGKLVITGTTATPNMAVRLDGLSADAYNATSGSNRSFRFELVYMPNGCVVSLQQVKGRTQVGAATEALVANCARGLSPRGEWSAKGAYNANDLVTHKGSTWLARRSNANSLPARGADWQLFAQNGSAGSDAAAQGDAGTTESQESAERAGAARVAPTGPAGGDLAGNYPNPVIRNGAVTTAKIANGAVSGLKIQNDAITTNKLANGSVGTAKLKIGAVNSGALANNAVTSAKVLDDTLTDLDLATNSVGQLEIQTDGVDATEIADNSIDSGEIVDFGLSNQDIGVLFAEVNGAGGVDNSSGGVSVIKLALGQYEVDFGRTISACTAVGTVGPSGGGSAQGELNVADRGGNAEAVFVDTNNSDGTAADRPFRLVVVC